MNVSRTRSPAILVLLLLVMVVLVVKAAQHAWDTWYAEDAQAESTPKKTESSLLQGQQLARSTKLTQDEGVRIDYGAIAKQNLFRPLGWQPQPPARPIPARPETRPAPPPRIETVPPTYQLILTGIAQDGEQRIAIVEDTQRDDGYLLTTGDSVQNAEVSRIDADHIVLSQGENTFQLALGESVQHDGRGRLLFGAGTRTPTTRPSTRVSTEQLDAQDTPSQEGQQSLLERMRERRRRELAQQ